MFKIKMAATSAHPSIKNEGLLIPFVNLIGHEGPFDCPPERLSLFHPADFVKERKCTKQQVIHTLFVILIMVTSFFTGSCAIKKRQMN